jgi:hypothetical protein
VHEFRHESREIRKGTKMTKINLSKALQAVRRTAFLLGLAMMLALMLGVATTALAAVPGDPFRLGRVNTINALTSLVGSVNNAMLKVDNNSTSTGATALNLQVEPNQAPLSVNSTAGKATNLDVDRLDGKSADELSRVAQGGGGARLLLSRDPVTAGTLSITAPAEGFVRVNGTIQVTPVFEPAVGAYVFPCKGQYGTCMFSATLRHINSGTTGGGAMEDVQNRYSATFPVNMVFPVSAGVNKFDVEVQRVFGASSITEGGDLEVGSLLTAEYTPYGSTGTGTLGAGTNVEEFKEFQQRLEEAAPQATQQAQQTVRQAVETVGVVGQRAKKAEAANGQ